MKSKIFIFLFACVPILTGCSTKAIQETSLTEENTESVQFQQDVLQKLSAAPNTEVSSKDYYTENNWNKKIVNLQMADLTRDGVDDYIVTIIYTAPTVTTDDPSEMLKSGGVGYIQVYDGSNTTGLDELGTLLWEKEFAVAHAGNAQVNLVHRDELDYLMPTDIYAQMGNYYFHYEVLYLDAEGNIYIVEEQSLNYNTMENGEQRPFNDEEKQEIANFKEKMYTWFEGATLLVAADVNLPKQLVSTPGQQYVPEDYYETALQEYIQ